MLRFGTLSMWYGLTQVSLEEVAGDTAANMIINFNPYAERLTCGDASALLI